MQGGAADGHGHLGPSVPVRPKAELASALDAGDLVAIEVARLTLVCPIWAGPTREFCSPLECFKEDGTSTMLAAAACARLIVRRLCLLRPALRVGSRVLRVHGEIHPYVRFGGHSKSALYQTPGCSSTSKMAKRHLSCRELRALRVRSTRRWMTTQYVQLDPMSKGEVRHVP